MRQDLIEQLKNALDDTARKKLFAYAYKLVSRLAWPSEGDLRQLAMDIASEAVCKTVADERKWNPDVTPDPIDFLLSTIKSIVDNRRKSSENKKQLVSADEPDFVELSSYAASPHGAAVANDFFCGLICEVGDDEVCAKMVDLFERGYKPDEIAAELGLSVTEIYAAKKRLKRKAEAYLQKSQGG